jgi:hypothetical protein
MQAAGIEPNPKRPFRGAVFQDFDSADFAVNEVSDFLP